MKIKEQMNEWKGTADHINEMTEAERRVLGAHLLCKYSQKMGCQLLDRVEGLASGHKIDHVTTQGLDALGIGL
jgi:hypothetical protein